MEQFIAEGTEVIATTPETETVLYAQNALTSIEKS